MSTNPIVPASAIVLTQPEIPNLAAIQTQIETFRSIAADLIAQAERAKIDSEVAFSKGNDFLTVTKTNGDEVEKLRKALKSPMDAWSKGVQNIFLPILDEFTLAKSAMSTKMLAWRTEQDRIARVAQEAARKKSEEEALARAAELEKAGNTAAAASVLDMASAPLPAAQKTEGFRGSFGGQSGTVDTWKCEVTNMRSFLEAVLAGRINFNLSDIAVGTMALNNLAKSIKVECARDGVKITKVTDLRHRG